MTTATAAATIVGALCLINIVLTLGVIRRLNELGRLPARSAGSAAPPPLEVPPGDRVGDFTVTAVDGELVSRADLKGSTLVAFMAPGCPSCEHSLPEFLSRAEAAPGGRDQVLAVVLGDMPDSGQMREQLAPVARVLVEQEEQGPLVRAFGVGALPAYALLSGDTMVASYASVERIPDTIPA
ncbi:Thiol-disulfide isomerase or thioredoxin [Thermomonospora echinospora]|uniref:Thiol-disulfide isomerase or thioredoxin n=1 Tax=Thermomonospora echinospora TaxID=1992 RepID=A0A1H6BF79_9ACTN|nr:redoxin family protein [Thermomonospora echinospora]SEG59398.1 Thiol-disulfide isomerase or thioredoxin [Thermomonospora echinospora]